MPFDPNLPANGSPNSSAEMRGQLTGLFDLIQAIPTPPTPITSFVVGATNTLDAGENASVTVEVEAPVAHFTFNIPNGAEGPTGPAFTNFVADAVTTLPAGSEATVEVNFDGTAVRLTFGIPAGPRGETGDVSGSQLEAALLNTAQNPADIAPLNFVASDPPTQAELQLVVNKVDELLGALRRV